MQIATGQERAALPAKLVGSIALIKVMGGVAKWRQRGSLLKLCVATAILSE